MTAPVNRSKKLLILKYNLLSVFPNIPCSKQNVISEMVKTEFTSLAKKHC